MAKAKQPAVRRVRASRILRNAIDYISNRPWEYSDLRAKYETVGTLLWALHEVERSGPRRAGKGEK